MSLPGSSTTAIVRYLGPQAMARYLQRSVNKGLPVLGLDVGDTKVGISISDATNTWASPVTRLARQRYRPGTMEAVTSAKDFARRLDAILVKHRACGLVVGYPLELLSGRPGRQCIKVRTFMEQLYRHGKLSVPFTFWDERLTTQEVRQVFKDTSMTKTRQNLKEDQMAATIILQNFLSHIKEIEEGPASPQQAPGTTPIS